MDESAMPARWKPVLQVLGEWDSYMASHVPQLQVFICNERGWSQEHYLERRKSHPIAQKNAGVYLIYNQQHELKYIGMATNVFDDRIWSHDEDIDRWYTDVIIVSREYNFLIPALELFLIRKFNPSGNSQHTV